MNWESVVKKGMLLLSVILIILVAAKIGRVGDKVEKMQYKVNELSGLEKAVEHYYLINGRKAERVDDMLITGKFPVIYIPDSQEPQAIVGFDMAKNQWYIEKGNIAYIEYQLLTAMDNSFAESLMFIDIVRQLREQGAK